jgi:AraC-like DNA-binding protein
VKRLIFSFKAGHGTLQNRLVLINQIANVLLFGIISGIFLAITDLLRVSIPNFDLRLAPYICYAIIPILIMRFKILENSVQTIDHAIPAQAIPQTSDPMIEISKSEHRYQKSSLDELTMTEYEQRLKQFMLKTKIYLNSELSLETLSVQVKIPKHHLTQVLNDRFKKNFYHFINEHRIEEAIGKLKHHQTEDNILSLAYDCGFNSKSSFNNYFKKVTGTTPSEFRKELLSSTERA